MNMNTEHPHLLNAMYFVCVFALSFFGFVLAFVFPFKHSSASQIKAQNIVRKWCMSRENSKTFAGCKQ